MIGIAIAITIVLVVLVFFVVSEMKGEFKYFKKERKLPKPNSGHEAISITFHEPFSGVLFYKKPGIHPGFEMVRFPSHRDDETADSFNNIKIVKRIVYFEYDHHVEKRNYYDNLVLRWTRHVKSDEKDTVFHYEMLLKENAEDLTMTIKCAEVTPEESDKIRHYTDSLPSTAIVKFGPADISSLKISGAKELNSAFEIRAC